MPSRATSKHRASKHRVIIECRGLALFAWLACAGSAIAQDLEPRRWAHLPVGMNVAGVAYGYTEGDLFFDPVLELEDVQVKSQTVLGTYARSLDFFGKTARVDVIVPYQKAHWEGQLSGVPAEARREGFADPWVRLSVNLLGAPALKGKEYQDYRTAHPISTVVGVALAVMLPLGEYQADKLLNLGQNRFVFRPQAGVVHTRGSWSYELTGSVFFFTENDDFFGGNARKQDPLFAFQAHVVHTFASKWWASVSAGYGWDGESQVNGNSTDDAGSNFVTAISLGLPIGKTQALKMVYLRGDTRTDVGVDSDTLAVSWTVRF